MEEAVINKLPHYRARKNETYDIHHPIPSYLEGT
jgi:hypothetical protein